jgi:hypothetical protein
MGVAIAFAAARLGILHTLVADGKRFITEARKKSVSGGTKGFCRGRTVAVRFNCRT